MRIKKNSLPDRYIRVAIGAVLAVFFIGVIIFIKWMLS